MQIVTRQAAWIAHVWLTVTVKDAKGEMHEWGLEGQSPAVLRQQGYLRTSIKPGEEVIVNINPRRDGTPWGRVSQCGRWEGDTLVVDTIGLNDKTKFRDGIPHTDALHVTERIRINEMGQLENRTLHEDPGAFLEPIPMVHLYERAAPFQEFVCAENNHEAVLAVPR